MHDLVQDCRFALRMMRRNVAFSVLIVFVLGLGIGANTAVFGVVHEILLKPLPYRDPARLLAVWDTYLPQFSKIGISPVELQAWQSQQNLFEQTAWYRYVPQDGSLVRPGAQPLVVHADIVSNNLFPMLGVAPMHGRSFGASEDAHSALLSYRVWQKSFGGDPSVIGKTVRFNDQQLTIVGVMPPEAQYPEWADLWLPKGPLLGDELANPVRHALGFIARLRPGVSAEQAEASLRQISRRLASEHSATSTNWGMRISTVQEDLTGDLRPALLLLLGAAAVLLFIACANIASLLVSRATGRTKEIAIRVAVGASSWRIVQQLATEDLILATLGGAAGCLLAKAGLLMVLPTHATLEPAVLLFLFATTLATAIFFGMAPAVHVLRADPQSVIKSASVTGSGQFSRSALVVMELALTLTLVVGAGILTRTFVRLMQVNPGFSASGVITARILAPPSHKAEVLFHSMQRKLLSIPGVETMATTNALPLIADRAITSRFNIPGNPLINPDALPAAQVRVVSPDYFAAMGIAVRSGRAFNEHDLNQPVVIINDTMAKRYWPGKDPVGVKFITGPWGPNPSWSTITGVVADVKDFGLDSEPTLDVYYPSLAGQYLVIKADRVIGIEEELRAIDRDLAVADVRSMDRIKAESSRRRRWTMGLLVTFAALAFVLAVVGIYGVMSWSVAQRTREVGIRMALGGQQRQVVAMVMGYGLKLTTAGLALGLLASLALRRMLASLVYGVSTADPAIYVSVPAMMLLVALAACYIPARKAARVDPASSLRYE